MKWLRDNWFVVVLIVAVIVLTFVLFKSCTPTKSADPHKKEIDSLKTVIQGVQMAGQKTIDSLTDSNKSFFESFQTAEGERSRLTVQLNDIKTLAARYKAQIKYNSDTVEILLSCDSLSDAFDGYVFLTEQRERVTDSMLNYQHSVIVNLDSINNQRVYMNEVLKAAFATQNSFYNNLYTDYSKLNKNNKWQKLKSKGLFIIVAGLAAKALIK